MFFCNQCGQSPFLSDLQFTEYVGTSGTITRAMNAMTEELESVEYHSWEYSDDSDFMCRNCRSYDVATSWEGEESQALEVRKVYNEALLSRARHGFNVVQEEKKEWDH